MEDRFRFRAVCKEFYSDKDDNDKEITFILDNVDVFNAGDIGTDEENIKNLLNKTNLTDYEKENILETIRDNSRGIDDYRTLYPEKILQCTGDKDRNNKLIYDGDFIKDITDNKIYKVTFESGCFWFGISEFSYLSNHNIEVIGNIYENPELLEKAEN